MPSPFVGGRYARVDQGVDWEQDEPYRAAASGTVIRISHGFTGGTGHGIYIKLDHPVKINGRTYTEMYYAEQTPLVKEGEHVTAGQKVMKGGAAELGFARNGNPAAALVGGLGAGTQASTAGHDFYQWATEGAKKIPAGQTPAAPPAGTAGTMPDTTNTAPVDTSQGDPNAALIAQDISSTPQDPAGSPDEYTPAQAGDGVDSSYTPQSVSQGASLWTLIASNGQVSPDTQYLASLSQSQ